MKIALGTAQLNQTYGISNNTVITDNQLEEIVRTAHKIGLRLVDTAPSYGRAESSLGGVLRDDDWKIVTKIKGATVVSGTDQSGECSVATEFKKSLSDLKRSHVYGVLLHDCDAFLKNKPIQIISEIQKLQEIGLVEKVGISIYNQNQLEDVLRIFVPEIVQLPISILDQRLLRTNILDRLKDKGIEIHARSIFLQGRVFQSPNLLPEYFAPMKKQLIQLHSRARLQNLSLGQMCLAFVASIENVDYVIVGVDSVNQLLELIKKYTENCQIYDYSDLAVNDERVVDIRNWS